MTGGFMAAPTQASPVDEHVYAESTVREIETLLRPGTRVQLEKPDTYFEHSIAAQLAAKGYVVVDSGSGAGVPVYASIASGISSGSVEVDLIVGMDAYRQSYDPHTAAAIGYWARQIRAQVAPVTTSSGSERDQLYALGRTLEKDNIARALVYYRQAAELGQTDASLRLGLLLTSQGKAAEGLPFLRMASDQGNAKANYVLGIATLNGDGVPRNPALARALLMQARDRGYAPASKALDNLPK